VILTKPSSEAEASALDQVLGSTDDPGNSDAGELVEAAFALEYQLRDFIADNRSVRLRMDIQYPFDPMSRRKP
jgi:hypothetical protein